MANRRIFDIIFRTKGLDKGKKDAEGLDNSFSSLAKTAKTVAIGFASVQAGLKAIEFAKLAAQTETVRRSFGNLAKEPDKMLQAMKKATAGTISEMELMQKFNEAALLGLPLERFDEMLNVARGAAQATGQSMDFMLNSIVTGLGRQSKLMLDNLGILVDVETANESYAESIGKTASQLTDQEKKQAFVNETLRVGSENLDRLGGVTESSVDSFGRFNASLADLQVTFGSIVLPLAKEAADTFSAFAGSIDAEDIIAYSISLGTVSAALGIYTVAQTSANVAALAFSKALPVIVFTTIVAGISEVVKEMKGLQEIAENTQEQVGLLFVGDGAAFQQATDILENNADLTKKTAEELKALGEEFSKLSEDTSQGLDIQRMFQDVTMKIAEELKKRAEAGNLVVKSNISWLETIKDLYGGNETEQAYLESLKGSYAEFIEQQKINFENQEKQKKYTEWFIASYPLEAEALGMLKDKTDAHSKAMNQQVQMAGMLSGALQTTFDPDLGAGEAFKGFIIQLISAMQGVVLASKAVSEALTFTFTGPLGVGAALASLAALEIAKAGVRSIKFAQFGIDEMVSQPTLIMAGEAGPERVQVTPQGRPSAEAKGGVTINFLGPVTNKEFVRDTIIPEIQKVTKLGLA